MGYGYGSEWQLLRFLGHHRNRLENAIMKAVNVSTNDFYWFDFDFANRDKIITGDAEKAGLSFLSESDRIPKDKLDEVLKKIKEYNWTFARWQYWDAVFILDGTLYFVEAKAHTEELKSGNKEQGGTSTQAILNFMSEMFNNQCVVSEDWVKEYYQFANRISTVALLNSFGIKSKLLNIYFINGYYDREHNKKKDTLESQFKEEIEKELKKLNLTQEIKDKYAVDLFIDANPE